MESSESGCYFSLAIGVEVRGGHILAVFEKRLDVIFHGVA